MRSDHKNAYRILEGKSSLPRIRWEGNIKMDLSYDGVMDWTDLAQDRSR
jgi:hypothetical protein